jgi:hypothetical protein
MGFLLPELAKGNSRASSHLGPGTMPKLLPEAVKLKGKTSRSLKWSGNLRDLVAPPPCSGSHWCQPSANPDDLAPGVGHQSIDLFKSSKDLLQNRQIMQDDMPNVFHHFFFPCAPVPGIPGKSCGSVTTRLKSGMRATQSNAERHLPSAGAAHTSGRLWNHWWFWENPLIATFFHWIFWMFIHWTPATWLLGDVWVFFYFFVKCANRRHDL